MASALLLLVLPCILAPAHPPPLAAQEQAPAISFDLAELPLRRVIDDRCRIDEFTRSPDPTVEQAEELLQALFGAGGEGDAKTYHWIVYFPTTPYGSAEDTLASRVYEFGDDRFVEGDKLYEADRLRILTLLARGPETDPRSYTVRAGSAVREEQSLLARGFPGFLSEILAWLAARDMPRGCAPPFRSYDLALHSTAIGTGDATLAARVEVDVSPSLGGGGATDALEAFRIRRVEIETRYLGYTMLGRIFDEMETALAGEGCRGVSAESCLHAARAAAVATVANLGLTAEHAIRAVREGTQQATAVLEQALAARTHELPRTFRVIDRPTIGFSVGGILAEGSGEKLKFKVKSGQVVAEGVEGDGFKTLALVDLYFRRVDTSEGAPGFAPHVSVGFTIGEAFRPGLFVGTTLPFTAGRLAVFGGGILRRETTTDLPLGSDVEPDSRPIRERYRFPLVAGLKVGLPF